MTDSLILIAVAAALAMITSFFVESSSWWLKAACPPGKIGLYVSRSNIYLYFGRFFVLVFNTLIALTIESAASASYIALTLFIGFTVSALSHAVLLRGGRGTYLVTDILARAFFLPERSFARPEAIPKMEAGITMPTLLATVCFCLGLSLPLLLAVFIPQYRMTLSYSGQILNAVGTFMLLFMVDQPLFRALDNGELDMKLPSYVVGRSGAFAIAAAACLALFIAL